MTEDELHAYATTLILEHARDVEYLSIHEMAEEHLVDGQISDEEAKKVSELISTATVVVSWPPKQGPLEAEVREYYERDGLIAAIRRYRVLTERPGYSAGLSESKAAVKQICGLAADPVGSGAR